MVIRSIPNVASYVGTIFDHQLFAEVTGADVGENIRGARVIRARSLEEIAAAVEGVDVGTVCIVMTQSDLATMRCGLYSRAMIGEAR